MADDVAHVLNPEAVGDPNQTPVVQLPIVPDTPTVVTQGYGPRDPEQTHLVDFDTLEHAVVAALEPYWFLSPEGRSQLASAALVGLNEAGLLFWNNSPKREDPFRHNHSGFAEFGCNACEVAAHDALETAEQDFLDASVAVWREIDRLSALPDGYQGLDSGTELRIREKAAWERYRDLLIEGGWEWWTEDADG